MFFCEPLDPPLFELKDILATAIAFAALFLSGYNFWYAQWRKANVYSRAPSLIEFALDEEHGNIRFLCRCMLFNRGSQMAVVTKLEAKLHEGSENGPAVSFTRSVFAEKIEVEDEKSDRRITLGYRAVRREHATNFVLPASDAVERWVHFSPEKPGHEFMPGRYWLRFEGAFLSAGCRAGTFESIPEHFDIMADDLREARRRLKDNQEKRAPYAMVPVHASL
jgi:hypothetical protein